ncbi:MAG: hypothetical protein ABH827_00450 [bacterium]
MKKNIRIILSCILFTNIFLIAPGFAKNTKAPHTPSTKSIKTNAPITPITQTQLSPHIALLDTTERDEVAFKPFIENMQIAGFKTTYIGIDTLMDQIEPEEKNMQTFLDTYHGVFFILGIEFLRGINTRSPLTFKILNILNYYAKQKDKLIGLILPTLHARSQNEDMIQKILPILHIVDQTFKNHIPTYKQAANAQQATDAKISPENSYNDFLYVTNQFLTVPIEVRVSYHTTLRLPNIPTLFYNQTINNILAQNKNLATLPTPETKSTRELSNTFPYGIYWTNPTNKNNIFITTKATISFSSLAENFQVCPMDFALRNNMLDNINNMTYELYARFTQQKNIKFKTQKKQSTLFGQELPKSSYPDTMKKTAWMEIPLFEDLPANPKLTPAQKIAKEKDRKKRQNLLIQYIYQAGLDSLWISLTPNVYYSPIAIHKNKEKEFLASVSRFNQQLAAGAKKYKKPVPKIFVGFEIADNLYNENLPKHYAYDLYGNTYTDIPAPLNQDFWHQELTASLKTFTKKWPAISHGIKLAGIVLDLEMYCRKTGDIFLSSMGFDHPTFQKFMNQKSNSKFAHIAPLLTVHQKTDFLTQNKLAKTYFNFLENQALKLGQELRTAFNDMIPNCVISCYSQSLFQHWFYKALWRGLSTQPSPLYLLTFNMEFNAHKNWFTDNQIYTHHSGVLMLSKIKTKQDFSKVKDILTHNKHIWLNRFSRLVENYDPKSWVYIEQTPLQSKNKQELLLYINKAH